MTKQAWIFASVISAVILIALGGFSWRQRGLALQELQTQLAAARATLEKSTAALGDSNAALTAAQTRIEALQSEKESVTKAQQDLEKQMRGALESKDITISELQGKLSVNILDRILFDSGEATIKPEGEKVLEQIASVLTQHPKRQIHVIGHTDNVPIRAAGRSRFSTNWELSTARATAAVRFLHEKANVDPKRLGAVGYGEFHPASDNNTVEGRARNRRITIVVLPEELAHPETLQSSAPGVEPNSPNQSPPPSDPASTSSETLPPPQ